MNIQPLKQVVLKLPVDSPLRTLVLSEADEMSDEEFTAKVGLYLKLLKIENQEVRA